jgi:putative RNA 2'-phosphotransferase
VTPKGLKKVSKFLSRHLRHESKLVTPDHGGWVLLDDLLRVSPGWVTREAVEEAVLTNDKQRFVLLWGRIRASQGHSIEVDLGLEPIEPPAVLYHGTFPQAVEAIRREGILRMSRHHVHMASETSTAVTVGRRSGTPVVFKIDAERMAKDGYAFYQSVNGVWLTAHVPADYLEVIE